MRMTNRKDRPKAETYLLCLNSLNSALKEPNYYKKKWRTDLIGIALQYGGAYRPKLKRADFEEMQKLPLEQVIKEIMDYETSL